MENSIILQNITPEILFSRLREVVREELSLNTPLNDVKEYLTRAEVAGRLNISLPTLNEYTKCGRIPAYRIGGRVLYKENEIENALKQVITKR